MIFSLLFILYSFSWGHASKPVQPITCLTSRCHSTLSSQTFIHGPVRAKGCTVCHIPVGSGTTSSQQAPLVANASSKVPIHHPQLIPIAVKTVNETCLICHENKNWKKYTVVHQAITDKSCISCHNPHGGNQKKYLKKDTISELCLTCHEKVGLELHQHHQQLFQQNSNRSENSKIATTAKSLQTKVQGSACLQCHDPHYTMTQHLLVDRTEVLCLKCHSQIQKVPHSQRVIQDINALLTQNPVHHKVVEEGKCHYCHNPHGNKEDSFLKLPYTETDASLCIKCHQDYFQTKVELTPAELNLTQFRNGLQNLHAYHLQNNRSKNTNCKTCHEVHASSQQHLIRNTFTLMGWNLPISYVRTENGGNCTTACHKLKKYDRINSIINDKGR